MGYCNPNNYNGSGYYLTITNRNFLFDTQVPLIDNLTPEVHQAPPDSKYGKTNLHDLKSSLIFKHTIVHPGGFGAHPQATDI